jgi:hypothetical protein
MALTRTYTIRVGDRTRPDFSRTVDVQAESESRAIRTAYAAAGFAGEAQRHAHARTLQSQTHGRNGMDLREFRIEVKGVPFGQWPTVRARTSGEAHDIAREQFGRGVVSVRSSRRITDAELLVEQLAHTQSEAEVEQVAEQIGLQARYVEDTHGPDGSTPEHYELGDGSVMNTDEPFVAHDDLGEWLSELGEAAHERLTEDFHAGDSGFRDPGSDVQAAHAQRRQLRSMDHLRPKLSDDLAEPAVADAGDDVSPSL